MAQTQELLAEVPATRPSKPPYMPEFDGLRAVAVLAVIAFHTMPDIFPGGFIGVDIFFVLSGFLITGILVREFASAGRIGFMNFYIRRCLRLMPALWLFLLVYVVVAAIWGGSDARDHLLAALSAGAYFMDWTKAFHLGPMGWLGHTWSLAIEAQFYLIFPFVLSYSLSVMERSSLWKPLLVLLAVSAAWRILLILAGAPFSRVYNAFDTRAETLLFGCVLAVAPVGRLAPFARRFWYVPVLSLLACLFLLAPMDNVFWPTDHWKPVLMFGSSFVAACAAWAMILISECRAGSIPVLGWKPVVYIGRISYGVYLWHFPIFYILAKHLPGAANFAATTAAAVLIASASYYLIEIRALRLKAKFRELPAGQPAG